MQTSAFADVDRLLAEARSLLAAPATASVKAPEPGTSEEADAMATDSAATPRPVPMSEDEVLRALVAWTDTYVFQGSR